MYSTPDASVTTEISTVRPDLVSSIHSDYSSHQSDSDHRLLPDIEISGELTAAITLVSDLTGGIRFATPAPTTNILDITKKGCDLIDGDLTTSDSEKLMKLDEQSGASATATATATVVSPDHSVLTLSSVGGTDEATSFARSVKEKLLSSPSQKPISTRSTPAGSPSPTKQPTPPRSVTPDSKRPQRRSPSPSKFVSPTRTESTEKKQRSTNPFDSELLSEKQASTNPFHSDLSSENISSAGVRTQTPKATTGEPKMVHDPEENDQFAVDSAVALSKASAKLSESGKQKLPLNEKEKDMVALAKAVALSEASSQLSKSQNIVAALENKPSPTATTVTTSQTPESHGNGKEKASSPSKSYSSIRKPRLDSSHLGNFFRGIIAQDQAEVMMNITWGGCSLPSSPACEVEVGLITSNRAVYLLEVLDPQKHTRRQLSWTSENLPLAKIMCIPITTLSKVTVGIEDQIIQAEFICKGIVKRFAMVPYCNDDVKKFVENLKAALEASDVKCFVSSPQELILSPPEHDDVVLFLNPDPSDLTKLKEAIVQPKTIVQVGNYIASSSNDRVNVLIDEEARCVTDDICSKFEIERYIMVAKISSDYLPIANDKLHLRSRVLILTNDTVYLCKEDFSMHPNDSSRSFNPPFPRCGVLDSHPLTCVTEVVICERPQPIVVYTDPVYEFSISFEVVSNVPASAKTTFAWQLCAQNKPRIEQFVGSLRNQVDMYKTPGLRITRTVDSISSFLGSAVINQPKKKSTTTPSIKPNSGSSNKPTAIQPAFFHSEMLIDFARLANFQRLKFFKKYIAQAEFMKSDEVPLSIFLSHCSTSDQDSATEIEACVLTSNYAIYLLSDLKNIQAWIDAGGPISFQRRALTSKKDASHLRCFYRLWLTDIKEIRVGLFYLSVIITTNAKNNSCTFVIHTNIPSATLSLLSALYVSVDLRDSVEEEELSDLLSDYIDLAAESVSKQSRPLVRRPSVEFIQQHDLDVDKLKQMLLGIGPKISRSRSIEESAATMQIFCQQVMLLVEEIRIRDLMCLKSNPHLVLLTNYGIFVCKNSNSDQLSPSVASPSNLQVREWCHVDLVDSVKVTSRETSIYGEHMLTIKVRSQNNLMERNTLCLLVQNCELLDNFLHFLCHVWQVRSSRQLPIQWE